MLFCFVSFRIVHSVTFRCIYLSSLSLLCVLYNIEYPYLYVRMPYFIENDTNWISRARENKRANERTNKNSIADLNVEILHKNHKGQKDVS